MLLQRDDKAVENLLSEYPDSPMAMWLYGGTLHFFRKEGDSALARRWRDKAKKANRHAPKYLSGKKKIPNDLPGPFSLGGEDEAVLRAASLARLWSETPGVLEWLETR